MKWEAQLSDGRTVLLEADQEPDEADIFSALETYKPEPLDFRVPENGLTIPEGPVDFSSQPTLQRPEGVNFGPTSTAGQFFLQSGVVDQLSGIPEINPEKRDLMDRLKAGRESGMSQEERAAKAADINYRYDELIKSFRDQENSYRPESRALAKQAISDFDNQRRQELTDIGIQSVDIFPTAHLPRVTAEEVKRVLGTGERVSQNIATAQGAVSGAAESFATPEGMALGLPGVGRAIGAAFIPEMAKTVAAKTGEAAGAYSAGDVKAGDAAAVEAVATGAMLAVPALAARGKKPAQPATERPSNAPAQPKTETQETVLKESPAITNEMVESGKVKPPSVEEILAMSPQELKGAKQWLGDASITKMAKGVTPDILAKLKAERDRLDVEMRAAQEKLTPLQPKPGEPVTPAYTAQEAITYDAQLKRQTLNEIIRQHESEQLSRETSIEKLPKAEQEKMSQADGRKYAQEAGLTEADIPRMDAKRKQHNDAFKASGYTDSAAQAMAEFYYGARSAILNNRELKPSPESPTATQGTPFERETSKPTTAMQYRGDINQKLEYIPETEVGRVQEAGRIIEGFGENIEGALKFFERPQEMSGVPISMRVIGGERLARQAAEREMSAKNDVDRLKWGEVRKRSHQLAQAELSQAGQILQTGAQLKREYKDTGAGILSEAETQFDALKKLDDKFPDLSPESKKRIYDIGNRIEQLSTLNQAEKQGAKTPEIEAALLRQKLAFTSRERLRAKVEIEVELAKEKLKNGWRGWLTPEGRRARASTLNQVITANLLTTPTFLTKQPIDVLSQFSYHVPTRALAQAINLPREGGLGQRTGQLAADFSHEILSSVRDVINSRQAAMRYALEGAKGRGSAFRDTLGFSQDMKFLERAEQKIQEAIKSKQYWKAIWPGYLSLLKIGIREARFLDELTGNLVENVEIRQQVEAKLREAGATPEQARAQAREAMGDFVAEFAIAEKQAQLISDASGIQVPASEFKAMVWDLVHQNALERVRALNLPAERIESNAVLTGRTFAWNEREIGSGPGGALLGTPLESIRKYLESAGLPSPFTVFANAISIGTNRALTHAGLGMLPKLFKGSKFYETPKDVTQRKIEASVGLAATAFFVMLAQSGLIRVRNRLSTDPDEKQQQESEGRKWGTVEINTGDGQFVPISMNTGPLAYFRIPLSIIGAIQDSNERASKQRERIEKMADKKELDLEQPVDGNQDLLGIALGAAATGAFGGRTLGGLQGAFKDPNQGFDIKKPIASAATSMIPLMPAAKAVDRLAGANTDNKRATLLSLILPSKLSDSPQRLNDWGQPVSPQTEARVVGILTGGSVPWPIDGKATDPVMQLAFKAGWSPPSVDPNKYFETEKGTFRKLTNTEIDTYLKRRGELLQQEMSAVLKKFPDIEAWDEEEAIDEFQASFRDANRTALEELRIEPPRR